jgi:hypothetical protein
MICWRNSKMIIKKNLIVRLKNATQKYRSKLHSKKYPCWLTNIAIILNLSNFDDSTVYSTYNAVIYICMYYITWHVSLSITLYTYLATKLIWIHNNYLDIRLINFYIAYFFISYLTYKYYPIDNAILLLKIHGLIHIQIYHYTFYLYRSLYTTLRIFFYSIHFLWKVEKVLNPNFW